MRVLTVKQPWASLIIEGAKDVENRTRPFPSTLLRCPTCNGRPGSWRGTVRFDGGDIPPGLAHTPCPWCDDTPREEYAEEAWPVRIWLHAGRTPDDRFDAWQAWDRHVGHGGTDVDHYGVIVGEVEVTGGHRAIACAVRDAKDTHWTGCSPWADMTPGGLGAYHWTLANPVPLAEPVPARGMLGLWRPDDHLAATLDQAGAA